MLRNSQIIHMLDGERRPIPGTTSAYTTFPREAPSITMRNKKSTRLTVDQIGLAINNAVSWMHLILLLAEERVRSA